MIPLFKIFDTGTIGSAIDAVYKSGFITEGEYSDRFETQFGEYVGNPNVCLVNSCTSALWLAGHVCGIRPGDEVITTAMTCMATNEPFYNMGAKLVFADVNPYTGNIDPVDVNRKITPKTKAIVVVHWAGQPVELDVLKAIAAKNNIKLIEDAAHALRAEYQGARIGTHGDFVCFSFQAIKHLSTVDGGAIVCKSPEDAARIRKLRWFGLDRHFKAPPGQPPASRWEQDIKESGYKMHMNNVNAAIGLEQMKHIDWIIDSHIDNGKFYDDNIHNENLELLVRDEDSQSSYWIYSLLVENRRHFKEYMDGHGIATDVVHVRNDRYSVFEQFRTPLPGLDYFESRLTHIPVGWWLTPEQRQYITDVVNDYDPAK